MDTRAKRVSSFSKFIGEYAALMKKMFIMTRRKRGQTIAEFLLAYLFLILLLAMRALLDIVHKPNLQLAPFFPYQRMNANRSQSNITFYYPSKFFFKFYPQSSNYSFVLFPTFRHAVYNSNLEQYNE